MMIGMTRAEYRDYRKRKAIARSHMTWLIEKVSRLAGKTPDRVREFVIEHADEIFNGKPIIGNL